jgi:hypothetical protein
MALLYESLVERRYIELSLSSISEEDIFVYDFFCFIEKYFCLREVVRSDVRVCSSFHEFRIFFSYCLRDSADTARERVAPLRDTIIGWDKYGDHTYCIGIFMKKTLYECITRKIVIRVRNDNLFIVTDKVSSSICCLSSSSSLRGEYDNMDAISIDFFEPLFETILIIMFFEKDKYHIFSTSKIRIVLLEEWKRSGSPGNHRRSFDEDKWFWFDVFSRVAVEGFFEPCTETSHGEDNFHKSENK